MSKNDEFLAFAEQGARRVAESGPAAAEELEDERVELAARLGENIVVAAPSRFEAGDGETLVQAYVHPPANKLGVLSTAAEAATQVAARGRDAHRRLAAPQWFMRATTCPPRRSTPSATSREARPTVAERSPSRCATKIVEGMLSKRFFAASRWRPLGAGLDPRAGQARSARRSSEAAPRSSSSRASPSLVTLVAREPRHAPPDRGGGDLPPRPAQALGRGADGLARVRHRARAGGGDRRGGGRRPLARPRDRDRRRRGEHLPRHGRGGRGHGPRHRRLRGHARDAAERADAAGRARAARRPDARAVRSRGVRGGRAVHPPPRDQAPREGPHRHLRAPAPATRSSPPTPPPRCARSRSARRRS